MRLGLIPPPRVSDRGFAGPQRPVMALGGGQWKNIGTVATGGTGYTWVNNYQIIRDCTDIRLVWCQGVNHLAAAATDGETAFQNRIPIKASVQVGTTLYRVFFNGQRQGYIDPGAGYLISDPIAVDIASGATITTRVYSNFAVGQAFGQSMATVGKGDANTGGYTANSDISDATTAPATLTSANYHGPSLILGSNVSSTSASVFGIGDSIDSGGGAAGTDDSANYTGGWMVRAMNRQVPLYRATYPSNTLVGFRNNHAAEAPLMNHFTHLLCGYGSNDIVAGRTLAQIQGDMTWLYQQARKRGLKVLQRTIIPRTDAGNATPAVGFEAGANSIRAQLNAWIRGGAGGWIDKVVECSDTVESARNSGLWNNVANTADGVHPTQAGAILMAGALTPAGLP